MRKFFFYKTINAPAIAPNRPTTALEKSGADGINALAAPELVLR